jgi:hypothetical protein
MTDTSIDEIVSEQAFAASLGSRAEMFFRLANTLLGTSEAEWTRRHPYQLVLEADSLEAFLDDHGARHNRAYHFLRELVASARGLGMAAFSLSHLVRRLSSYHTNLTLYPERERECHQALNQALGHIRSDIGRLLVACQEEALHLGLTPSKEAFPKERFDGDEARRKLPRNLGQEVLEDEGQRIAEVASKYLQVCEMFDRLDIRPIQDELARERYLGQFCSEEQARVYEATVHNLQSAYDTYIKNTVVEAGDDRLPRLRGHASAALHLLEAVTQLAHFVERHESGMGPESSSGRIAGLVDRSRVREITLNVLLYWAAEFMTLGRGLAEELLPAYTNIQDLVVELAEGLMLHARPVSLIVGIVQRYGTPVEMLVGDSVCDASSILELMIAVGSNSMARRYTFRGDENPLRDIRLLFESGLGEGGLSSLPEDLGYLR